MLDSEEEVIEDFLSQTTSGRFGSVVESGILVLPNNPSENRHYIAGWQPEFEEIRMLVRKSSVPF